jgi:hypothetical protein
MPATVLTHQQWKEFQLKSTRDDLIINLSSRKLAITVETIPQEGIQLSNNPETKQPNNIFFPKRKPNWCHYIRVLWKISLKQNMKNSHSVMGTFCVAQDVKKNASSF